MGSIDPLKPIILFDGVCNLCNQSVQFVIRHDSKAKFNFAPLQSEFANSKLREFSFPTDELNTILLIKNNKLFQKSSAALEVSKSLNGLWPALYFFIIVPTFIRDWVYDRISKNRYSWFGKKDECMIPTQELKSRFLN